MRPSGLALQFDTMPLPRGVGRALRAARIVHPFPTLLNVAATAALAFIAERGQPPPGLLATMLLVMFCAQAAIGAANDIFDRELDARTKPWKPLVAGLVPPAAAAALAVCLAVTGVALAATLGAAGFGLALLGLACGLAYDVRLKRSWLSAIPYMVGIPVLPLWVWATLGRWQTALWLLLPLGALIGLALHLANTLPDIDDDAAHGVRGLAHHLGVRWSMFLAWASFGGAIALSAVLARPLGYDPWPYIPAASVGAACLAVTVALHLARRDQLALRSGFAILSVGAAVLAVGWLAAVS